MRSPTPSRLGRCIPLVELISTVAGQLVLLLLVEQPLLAKKMHVPCCATLYAHLLLQGLLLLRAGFQQTRQGLMYRCRGDLYRDFNRCMQQVLKL